MKAIPTPKVVNKVATTPQNVLLQLHTNHAQINVINVWDGDDCVPIVLSPPLTSTKVNTNWTYAIPNPEPLESAILLEFSIAFTNPAGYVSILAAGISY